MSSINLGPFNINKPTDDEKHIIRQSLDLGDASLLDAQFTDGGNILTISQPGTSNIFEYDKRNTSASSAEKLSTVRAFSINGPEIYTQYSTNFDGTTNVVLNAALRDLSIGAIKIADGAIVGQKIANNVITPLKLSAGAPSWDVGIFSTGAASSRLATNSSGPISLDLGYDRSGAGDSSIRLISVSGDNSGSTQLVRSSGTNGSFRITNNGSGTFNLNQTGAGDIRFTTDSKQRVSIGGFGGLTIDHPDQGRIALTVYSGSAQLADTIHLQPTAFSGSERAAILIDDWRVGQDRSGNGTRNFFIDQISTNSSRIFIDSNGGVAIGKTSLVSGAKLDVNGTINALGITASGAISSGAGNIISGASSSSALTVTQLGSGNALVVNDSSGNPDSTPFVINNGGTVIVGHTSNVTTRTGATTITPKLQVIGTNADSSSLLISRFNNDDATSPRLFLSKSRGTVAGNYASVIDNDNLGVISFGGADGTKIVESVRILAEVDGSPSTGNMPGCLTFSTASSGINTTPTERMRIASSGNVGIGTSIPASKLHVVGKITTSTIAANGDQGGGSTIFSDSSEAALTVRQTGVGNAFVVEDVAGDSTPFVITSDGNVGIRKPNPTAALDVNGTIKATAFEGPITGTLSGNADSASKLLNAKTIAISGAITGTATSFDGSQNITIAASITNGSIVNDDISNSANIALSKLASGALPSAITVASANIVNGTIVNDDINASAAIAGSKINPNFGSQNITTNGTIYATTYLNLPQTEIKQSVVDHIYPIGSVFFSANNINPGSRFTGTTWTRIAQGRFIVGVGTGSDGTYDQTFAAGNTAGEYRHRLTVDEMPSHRHGFTGANGNVNDQTYSPFQIISDDAEQTFNPGDAGNTGNKGILNTGGDAYHENTPPGFGLYVWQRTA